MVQCIVLFVIWVGFEFLRFFFDSALWSWFLCLNQRCKPYLKPHLQTVPGSLKERRETLIRRKFSWILLVGGLCRFYPSGSSFSKTFPGRSQRKALPQRGQTVRPFHDGRYRFLLKWDVALHALEVWRFAGAWKSRGAFFKDLLPAPSTVVFACGF